MLISLLRGTLSILIIMLVPIHRNLLDPKDLLSWVTTSLKKKCNNKPSSLFLAISTVWIFTREDHLLDKVIIISSKISNLNLKIKINLVLMAGGIKRKNLNSSKCNRSRLHRGGIIYSKGKGFYILKHTILWSFRIWQIHLKTTITTRIIDNNLDHHQWVIIKIYKIIVINQVRKLCLLWKHQIVKSHQIFKNLVLENVSNFTKPLMRRCL